jgi:hypothetical protein
MEKWRHGEMRHGHMGRGDMKQKTETQAIFP